MSAPKPTEAAGSAYERWLAPSDDVTARFFFLLTAVLGGFALPALFQTGGLSGNAVGVYSLRWTVFLAGCILLTGGLAALFIATFTSAAPRLRNRVQTWTARISRLGRFNLILAVVVWLGFILAVFWLFDRQFVRFAPRLWMFWLAAGLAGWFVSMSWRKLPYFWGLLASSVVLGFCVRALGYLPGVSNFPFSLGWSEASRYYYASLPFSVQLYGQPVPLSPWHASRYLMLGLAFLIEGLPLWVHRLWQVLLWLGMSLGTGWVIMRRFGVTNRLVALVGACWAALFLIQGPVYYHLLVCVWIVVIGYDARRPVRTLLVVVAASLWAGISRVNWFPVPALLAAVLYLLAIPRSSARSLAAYVALPGLWGIAGMTAAVGSQFAYIHWLSGQTDRSQFGSTFSSDLLWYRLLPSPTSDIGVLWAILIVSAPFLLLLAVHFIYGRECWQPLRLLGLLGIGGGLFAGGLLVSTKIGGGSNIHNLDAYIVVLLLVGAAVWLGSNVPEGNRARYQWRPWWLTFLILALPSVWNLDIGMPFERRDLDQGRRDLQLLSAALKEIPPGGEVLFISQRHLLAFGMVEGVDLVPDYELLTLSEMAISGNRDYLDRFKRDLEMHRFKAIVVEAQNDYIQDPRRDAFAEENNAWKTYIAAPLLANYYTGLHIDGQNLDLMFPKP